MSIHPTRRRLGAGALAAGLLVLGPATAFALAGVPVSPRAELNQANDVDGLDVMLERDVPPSGTETRLVGLEDDGAALWAYCVQFFEPLNYDEPQMVEVPWNEYPDPDSPFHENRDEIHWILQNSYPVLDLNEVETAAGGEFNDGLSVEEAIGGTQAAIWLLSDELPLNVAYMEAGSESEQDAAALYTYLTGEANVGIGDQPEPELSLTPASLSGEAGTVIGPFEVSTTADVVDVTADLPEGVELVDSEGTTLPAQITDGSTFSVDVPADAAAGGGSFELTAEASLSAGRLFIAADYDKHKSQSLILAHSDEVEVSVEGTVDWTAEPAETPTPTPSETPSESPTPTPSDTPSETPTPTPSDTPSETPSESPTPSPSETPDEELPDTGASPTLLLAVGLGLVAAAAFLLRRRFAGAAE
ncbi:TQXA domain-containing protein [Jiangella aurantiaca]|uniref:TQXA domain-containing protein n=1 Tax=Jiangella aurantiaca TaxID=2530373 RepID=A0A4R5AJB8_9ACTN|nr:thioester domain-containing protein [Jiangella aurantiaca]TDD70232.1 TQXA domain-containing protein [Jiangella aurantiaca]